MKQVEEKDIHIGDADIPLNDFSVARTGVLGITRSGKTYCAKGIAEQMLDADIPIIVFDAIGVWRFLKTPGDGSHAKGYPIVVAGGEHPDLPLTPHSAPEIVRAAMRENVPLVIDLYDAKLSKSDWRQIVQSCFRVLLYENKTVRHIFLEEAAEYCPQKIMDGQTYAEVEKLARMGGNKGLGITFINQRAQELNKAVLELSDNLILLRQRGSHAIDALEKWLDKVSPDMAKEIAASLPNMTQGDCWVWMEGSDRPVRTRTRPLRSFHPDRRTMNEAEVSRKSVDAGKFVAKMSGELVKIVEQSKANDPKELKRRISELEKQLAAAPDKTPIEKIVEVPVLKNGQLERTEKIAARLESFGEKLADHGKRYLDEAAELRRLITPASAPRPVAKPHAVVPRRAERSAVQVIDGDPLPVGERSILIACAQYGSVERNELTTLTGYKRSTRDRYLQFLAGKGFIQVSGSSIAPTPEGIAALGDFEPLPSGDDLCVYWLNRLPEGERKLLEVLRAEYPNALDRDTLSDRAGYKRSTRDRYLQFMQSKRIVQTVGKGVRMADSLSG